jgi:NAD(P)-dependent dehydrogenase (short-subunit alcohol dehydrogenase family)
LVTGANRGFGSASAQALLDAGAAKVYAGASDPRMVKDPRMTPIRPDITSSANVATAAATYGDVDILINNAGTMLEKTVLSEDSLEILKREMDANVLGLLAMCKAFAPVLARNEGGVIVNMLSVASWYVYPLNSTYCATRRAALAVTDGLRIELKAQGTRVLGVYAGFIDTEMGASLSSGPKTSPHQMAKKTIEGIIGALDGVLADEAAGSLWRAVRQDLAKLHAQMQVIWDERSAALDKENN